MSDDFPAESSSNSLKRTRSESLPAETQEQVGDESQISTFSIDEEISCGICLGVLESPYTVIPCLHTFDKDCLAGWWKQNNTCPLCKVQATSGRHSFQLQAIVNHYDNKRPPHKRAKGSDEPAQNDDRAELYPFGVAPLPGAIYGHQDDDEEDEEEFNEDDEEEEEEEDDLMPGGRLVFPCPACRPGHPSGYTCPIPIPEPTEAAKRTEKEDYFNGRRDVVAPARGQQRVRFSDGLHALPGAGLVYQDQEIADITRACEDHVMCHACAAYIPRNWPRGVESMCDRCSKATCMIFDPQQCPHDWNNPLLRPFDGERLSTLGETNVTNGLTEAGSDIAPERLWNGFTGRYPHFRNNAVERDRFLAMVTAKGGINSVVVVLMGMAGYAQRGIGPFYCFGCVEEVVVSKIQEWYNTAKETGPLPEAANLSQCWYGKECRTQSHNINHAQRFTHDCDPRPQPQAQPQPPNPPLPPPQLQANAQPLVQPQPPLAQLPDVPIPPIPMPPPQPDL
ncbi:Zinc finger, C3HC4 type (RING finger) protein [Ceratobasidium sp. AG-Ba]|nr:Zinc finger, C3HC4 type (RING finger) protein [Ceratobasidium sp. AG-Ba]QRW10974.1 Zinc finger, C3HC4 type (RING finger) protein [Ceratobasidium sp. AG-Ba]